MWNTAYPRFQNAGIACDFILLNGAEFRNSSGQLLLSHKMDLAFVLHIIQQLTVLTSSDRCNLEFTSIESQKDLMLERVLELYQISKDDVLIFGDGENDFSLFQRFPHTIAMGNAAPALMGMAEKVIGYHYQNGVATELFSFLDNPII